jgi:hypothetical protein
MAESNEIKIVLDLSGEVNQIIDSLNDIHKQIKEIKTRLTILEQRNNVFSRIY